jgi:hypothetical protein
MELIPQALKDNYIIHNETMKYSTFDDEEFEKNITDENITEQILIDNINQLENTIDLFVEHFFKLIKEDRIGINKYLHKYDMKTLEYIIVSKAFKLLLKELKIKLNDKNSVKEANTIYNFETFIKEFKEGEFTKFFIIQFPEPSEEYSELKKKIETIFNYIERIRSSKAKIGLIHLNLMIRYINIFTNKIINEIFIISDMQKMKSESKNHILSVLVSTKRILTYPFSVFNSFLLSSDDICNIPEKSKEWDKIKKITFRVNSKEDDKIRQLLQNGNESQSYILSVFMTLLFKRIK